MGRKRRARRPQERATAAASAASLPAGPAPARWGRPTFSRAQVLAIVVRNVVPLAGLWLWNGSIENFLLLCVFNCAYAVASLGTIGVAVSTRPTRLDTGLADTVAAWTTLAFVCLGATLLLSALFGWVVALIASASPLGLWNADLGWSLLCIVAASLPALARQYRDDVASHLSDAQRQERDRPQIGSNLLSAGIIFILAGYAAQGGHAGVVAMAFAITALFVFRDLRPDLMRDVVPSRTGRP